MKKIKFWCLVLVSLQGFALPSDPTVVAGSATFDYSVPGRLTINATTDRTIIEWVSFSVAAGEVLVTITPQDSSATLNRVIGATKSFFEGSYKCNNVFYIVNSNGISVGSQTNWVPCALLLSTLDVSNSEFLAGGDMLFSGDSTENISLGGYLASYAHDVTILGRHITNQAYLEAFEGVVGIGAGKNVLYSPSATQRLTIQPQAGTATGVGIAFDGYVNAQQVELKADGPLFTQAVSFVGGINTIPDGGAYIIAEGGTVILSGNGGIQGNASESQPSEIGCN